MVRTQIQLSEDDYAELRLVAGRQGRSLADCIREGIGLFLERTRASRRNFGDVPAFHAGSSDDLKDHDQGWADSILGDR